jgi:glycosyltransferase involved in cell wall biosynthesis
MRVAVVIAARDVASFLGTAISSVLEQSRADLSLTVVDDGSVDDTAAIIGGFADDRLTLVRETGRGLSAARNRGAAEAGAFDVAVHAPFAYVAESACPDDPGPLDRRTPPRQTDLLPRLLLGNVFANGGHVLIRAEAWSKAGSFREDVRFCEDWEFWPRLLMQGRVLGVGGAPQLFVRRRAGSLMHSKAIRHESYRPALAAIAANTALASHLGEARFRRLLRRAETELDWTIGREMFRRGDPVGARPLLWRGLWGRPRPQRLALLALALTRRAPPETADAARN